VLDEEASSLVAAAASGDDEAFAALYREYRPRLVARITAWTHDRHLAEDLAQETLVRAHRALPRFRVDAPLWPWLSVIARNVTTDELRRRREVSVLGEDGAVAADAIARSDDRLEIEQALSILPPRSRQALLLVYSDGLASDEAARRLGTSRGAFQKLLQRSRGLFGSALERVRSVPRAAAERQAVDRRRTKVGASGLEERDPGRTSPKPSRQVRPSR